MESQLTNVRHWKAHVLEQSARSSHLYERRWQQTKARRDTLYRQLTREQLALEQTELPWPQIKHQIQEKRQAIARELDRIWAKVDQTRRDSNQAWEKARRYDPKRGHKVGARFGRPRRPVAQVRFGKVAPRQFTQQAQIALRHRTLLDKGWQSAHWPAGQFIQRRASVGYPPGQALFAGLSNVLAGCVSVPTVPLQPACDILQP